MTKINFVYFCDNKEELKNKFDKEMTETDLVIENPTTQEVFEYIHTLKYRILYEKYNKVYLIMEFKNNVHYSVGPSRMAHCEEFTVYYYSKTCLYKETSKWETGSMIFTDSLLNFNRNLKSI
jgi:hypothetical protein